MFKIPRAPEPISPPPTPELGVLGRAAIHCRAFLMSLPWALGWLARRGPRLLGRAILDSLIGAGRTFVYVYSWAHMSDEREAIRRMENADARAKAKREINKDARYRQIGLAIVAALAAVGLLVLIHGWPDPADPSPQGRYAWIAGCLGLLVLILFWWIGRRPRDDDGPVRRPGPLTHGTSSRTLRRDLEEGFLVRKIPDVGVVGLTVNKHGWHGVFETERKIDDELVAHLERWVHAPEGSLLVGYDPRNSAARPFKLLIDDPLAQVEMPDRPPPGTLDIRKPQRIGRHLFGQPLMVNLRQHIGLVGRSGAGKSSGLWVLMDRISRAGNAEMDGIDLSQGPLLAAWRGAVRRRGTDPATARSILEEALELATARNTELARMAESDEIADWDENWDPRPGVDGDGSPLGARYVVIDEFHILADDKELLELVKLLIRVGRKAAVHLILATPGASKEDLGSTLVKAMVGLKLLFATDINTVTAFLGGRMAEQGWRPDKLAPAAGGNPRDAGKAYIWDGDHQSPEVVRVARLGANEVRDRAREVSSISAVTLAKPAPQEPREPAEQVLRAAFQHFGRDRIPVRWLDEFVSTRNCGWTYKALRAALDEQGVTTDQIGRGPWGANARGYRAS